MPAPAESTPHARRLFLLIAAAACAVSLPAADWSHPRGPQFDGRFPRDTPLPPWPASGPALLWEQALGQGFSGMVVAGGRVFTQHQGSSGQELMCLDLASGAVVWRTRYAFPWEMDGRYPGTYGTPTVADGRVYFSDCYGVIGCARAADGEILWRFDAVKKLGSAGVDFGYAAAPLVLAGRVYAPALAGDNKATALCLDAATGALVWQTGTTFPSYGSFTPITVAGKACLLLPLRNGVGIYDRQTGEELWKEEWSRGYDEHSCWPIYQEPYLFFPSAFRRAARVFRFAWSEGRLQADTVWEERVLSNDVLSSALHDGHLYGFDVQSQQSDLLGRTRGSLKCVELATGVVRWTQAGIKHCSVTPVGARFLLLEDEGDLVLMDPSAEGYRELARASLPQKGKFWATPVVVDDRLLIRGRDSVACYSLGAGGPKPVRPAPLALEETRGVTAKSSATTLRGWFDRHRSDSFVAPSGPVLFEWYLESVVLLTAAFALGRVKLGATRRVGWVWSAVLLGLVGTGGLTAATGRFSFTVPLSLFALFCATVPACRDPGDADAGRGRGIRPILRLVVFIALCFAYYRFCGWLFLVAGWGFLAGFPSVVLLAWVWQRSGAARGKLSPAAALVWSVSAFTAYFWTSAAAIVWNAK